MDPRLWLTEMLRCHEAPITISASYGAGGSEVGPRLADRLGVPLVDRAIPAAVCDRLSVSLEEAFARRSRRTGR